MSPQLIIASVVAVAWFVLVLELLSYLFYHRRKLALETAVRTAVCAVESLDQLVERGETRHEAAARLAAELDPHTFRGLSDAEKSALIAAAYFVEVMRPRRFPRLVSLPQGIT